MPNERRTPAGACRCHELGSCCNQRAVSFCSRHLGRRSASGDMFGTRWVPPRYSGFAAASRTHIMNREKRKRRLQVKVQLEKLETRWLMRAGLGITSALRPLAAPMAETEIRATHSPGASGRARALAERSPASRLVCRCDSRETRISKSRAFRLWRVGSTPASRSPGGAGAPSVRPALPAHRCKVRRVAQHHPAQAAKTGITAPALETSSGNSNTPTSPQTGTPASANSDASGASPQPGQRANLGLTPDAAAPSSHPPC